jgi:UDP:flavonoid glycosyltransferase YjiC (YdhE family)
MRVLFTTTGHAGHALPLVPFARACARAGHEVRVATQRSRTGVLARTGLPVLAFDDPLEHEMASLFAARGAATFAQANDGMAREMFGRIAARAALPGALAAVESFRPDVVVRESCEFAGALAAERHGLPHVRVNLGLASMEEWILDLAAGPLEELRAERGLAADPGAERLRGGPALTLVPPSLDDPAVAGGRAGLRYRHPAPPAPTPADSLGPWAQGEDPLVYVSFGSVAGGVGYFPALYRAAIDALAPLGVRVLVTTGQAADPAELGALPANVHAERWVPQDEVAARASAVVCHGGSGSVLGALAHGLPPVVVPLFAVDQWINAHRVAAIGAGAAVHGSADPGRRALALPESEVTARLADVVGAVLEAPGTRLAARRVAAEMASLSHVERAPEALRALADGELPVAA